MGTRALKAILICAAVIRLALLAGAWSSPARLETPDSRDYIELSDALVHDAAFGRDGQAEIFRTPGYPFFLIVGSLFGESWWKVVVPMQIALDVLLVYMTFLLGTLLWDQRAGLWAAAFQAVAAVSVAASLRILSDGLFAVLLTLSVLLGVHHFKTSKWWSLVGAAAAAGLGCYLRPVGLVFCLLMGLVLLARVFADKARLRSAAAFAGIVIAIVAPWVIRNRLAGDFTGFSSFTGDSMYFFAAPKVLARVRDIDPADARGQMRTEDEFRRTTALGAPTPGQAARYRRRRAREIIMDHPGLYAKIHLRGSAAVFLPGVTDVLEVAGVTTGQRGTLDVLHRSGVWAAVKHYLDGNMWALWVCIPAAIVLTVKYGFVLICAAGRARWRMGAGGWLILLTIVVFALAGGPAATPRFRIPIAPLLSVAAGAGAAMLRKRGQRKRGQEPFSA